MIELRHVQKKYRNGSHTTHALHDINLQIERGEIYGIIGHSGAGKSTLLRSINLLERPTAGSIIVDGVELTALPTKQLQEQRRRIGMIFQHFNLLSSATVEENVAFPLKLVQTPKQEVKQRVDELLDLVGLSDQSKKYPAQLSGGQKQRVGIARALATNPHVLLCDEATSALDPQTTNSILGLLLDINRKLGITIVLITHEMQVIRSICDRVAVIHQGQIVEQGPVAEVFIKPRHEVTRQFIEQVVDAVDLRGRVKDERATVLKISFLGESTYEPILSRAVQQTGVTFSILQGTISRMKNTPYGQLVIRIEGSRPAADETIRLLKEHGLDVEVYEHGLV
ncbi:methionine ABC transporter ATP-binding protein [Paenibacillus sp. J2TS4]|uniref:methionine ABC transporter ATP-binding protein n=1 Tax=Paenibacillus sp. J2TS4 TaxID=2807194 RepID=UPI001B16C36F|nr:methionine ABC transporter ATP-binding protein [Paenibacillus sp. J2TS4]GIP32233.1 methionine import ATP-binding protein MetN [Paenibacillus sp. J2TS4]